MLLALLLAGINAIPPLLFFIYCCTKGRALRAAVLVGQAANVALFVGGCMCGYMEGIALCAMLIASVALSRKLAGRELCSLIFIYCCTKGTSHNHALTKSNHLSVDVYYRTFCRCLDSLVAAESTQP